MRGIRKGGRRGQHEDCSQECWENPLWGRKSIRVVRGNSSGLYPATPSQLQSVRQRGRGSWEWPPPLEGPWHRDGGTLDPGRLGTATHSEFRERRPWKASGAISAIWLLLRSLQGEQEGNLLNPLAATGALLGPSSQMPQEGRHF